MKIKNIKDLKIFSENNLTAEEINAISFEEILEKEELIDFLINKFLNSSENYDIILYSELIIKILPIKLTPKNANDLFKAYSKCLRSYDYNLISQVEKIGEKLMNKEIKKEKEVSLDPLEVKNEIKFVKEYNYFQECLDDLEDKESVYKCMPHLLEKASFYMLDLYKEELLDALLNETEYKTFDLLIIIQKKMCIYKEVVLFLFNKKSSLLKRMNCLEFLYKESKNVDIKTLKHSFNIFLLNYKKEYFNTEISKLKIMQWIISLSKCFSLEIKEFLGLFNVKKEIFSIK